MGVLKKLELDFGAPPPPELTLDEKTQSYIEKLQQDVEREFLGPLEVKIDDFEGPLDLLLHLVRQARVDIKDIFVSKITDQFLSLIEGLEKVDLEKASEFISIAAIFIEVKSKALLPVPEFVKPDDNDPGKELIRKLEEYKLLKDASEKMRSLETVGAFYKPPEPQSGQAIEVLKDMTTLGLYKAMQKLFSRLENRPAPTAPRQIAMDRFTVADKMGHMRDIMAVREEVNFFELFDADYSKLEIITTFQALLELLKLQHIYAEQTEAYADILIKRREYNSELIDDSKVLNDVNN